MRCPFFTITLAWLLINSLTVAAQSPSAPQPPTDAGKNFIAIKVFGTPTLLLVNGAVGSAGLEYSFHHNQSVGISFAYAQLGNKFSYNDSIQKAKGYPYQYRVERGIMVYYRLYAKNWWPVGDGFCRPYAGLFGRAGNADLHFDKGYETSQVKYDEMQYAVGLMFGTVWSIDAGPLCMDAHIGPFYKWRTVRDAQLENGAESVKNYTTYGPGIKMGITLSYIAERRK